MIRPIPRTALAGTMLALWVVSAAVAQASSTGTSPAPIAWTPGTCPTVTDGDLLSLEWNPSFEHAGSITGIQQFELRLAKDGDDNMVRRTRSGLTISAKWARTRQGVENPFVQLPNGFYKVQLHLDLQNVEPGRYHLVEASAAPRVSDDYRGELPQMTNTPLRSAFCLNVTAATHLQRGR